MVKKQKIEIMIIKNHKNRKRMNIFGRKKENYKSDKRNNMDFNQANNKYLL